jgi:hypothetical protein
MMRHRQKQQEHQGESGLPPVTVTRVKFPFLTEGGRVCRARASSTAPANAFNFREDFSSTARRDILLELTPEEEARRVADHIAAAAAADKLKPLFGKSVGSANIHLEAYEKRRQRLLYLEWTMKHDALEARRADGASRSNRVALTARQQALQMLPGMAGASRDFCDGENDVTSRALARLDVEERDAVKHPSATADGADRTDPSFFSTAAALDWKGGLDLETLRRTAPKFSTIYHFAPNPLVQTAQEQKRMVEAAKEASAMEALRARNPGSSQYAMERHVFHFDPVRRLWQDASSQTELFRALHRARFERQSYLERRRFLVNLIPDLRFFSELLELHDSIRPGARQCQRCSRWHQCCLASALDGSASKARFHCSGNLFAPADIAPACSTASRSTKVHPGQSPFDAAADDDGAARAFLRAFAANPDLVHRRWKKYVAAAPQQKPEGAVPLPSAALPNFMTDTKSTVEAMWSTNHVSTKRLAKLEVADILPALLELVPDESVLENEDDVRTEDTEIAPPVASLNKKDKGKGAAKRKGQAAAAQGAEKDSERMIPRWVHLLRLHGINFAAFDKGVTRLWTGEAAGVASDSAEAGQAPLPPPSSKKRGRREEVANDDNASSEQQPLKLTRVSRSGRAVKAPSQEVYAATSLSAASPASADAPATASIASSPPPAPAESEISGLRAQFRSTLHEARIDMAERCCRMLERLVAAGLPVDLVRASATASTPLKRIVVGKHLAHPTYWYEACLLTLRRTAHLHHFDLRPSVRTKTLASSEPASSGTSSGTKTKDDLPQQCDAFGFLVPREDREKPSLKMHLCAAIGDIRARLAVHFGEREVPKLDCFLPQIKAAELKRFPLARRLRFAEVRRKPTSAFNACDWRWNMQHLVRTVSTVHVLQKEARVQTLLNLSAELAMPYAELWYMDSPEACADGVELHNYNKHQKACEFLRVIHPEDCFASEPKWFSRLETAKEYMRGRLPHKAAATTKVSGANVHDAATDDADPTDDGDAKSGAEAPTSAAARKRSAAAKKSDTQPPDGQTHEDKNKSPWLSWVDVETGETMLNMARMGGFYNDAHMCSGGAHRDWCAMQCRDECTRACGELAFRQHDIPCEHAQRRRVHHALVTMRSKLAGGGGGASHGGDAAASSHGLTTTTVAASCTEVDRLMHRVVGWICRVLAQNIFNYYKQYLRAGLKTFSDYFVGLGSKLFAEGHALAREDPPDAVFQTIANHDLDPFWKMLNRIREVQLRILPELTSSGDTASVRKYHESTPSFAQTRVYTGDDGLPNSGSIFAPSHATIAAGVRKRKRASAADVGASSESAAAGDAAATRFDEHTTLAEIREAEQRAADEETLLKERHDRLRRRPNKNNRKAAPASCKSAQIETGIWYAQTLQQCWAQRLQDPAGWVSHLVLGPSAERHGFHPWMPLASQHVRLEHLQSKIGRFAWLEPKRLEALPIDRELYDARRHGDAAATIFEFAEGEELLAVQELAPLRMSLNLLKWLSRWLVAHESILAEPAQTTPTSSRWVSLLEPTHPVHEWSLPRS